MVEINKPSLDPRTVCNAERLVLCMMICSPDKSAGEPTERNRTNFIPTTDYFKTTSFSVKDYCITFGSIECPESPAVIKESRNVHMESNDFSE